MSETSGKSASCKCDECEDTRKRHNVAVANGLVRLAYQSSDS